MKPLLLNPEWNNVPIALRRDFPEMPEHKFAIWNSTRNWLEQFIFASWRSIR